jgi:hypothetical protein
MVKETNEVLDSLHGLVLLLHNSINFIDIVNFLNKIRLNKSNLVMYVSFVNSYSRVKELLYDHPLQSKRLFVIDCVSGYLIDIQDSIDCIYRKPPFNLDQLKELLLKNIGERNPNIVVIDSMSQFINFTNPTDEDLEEFYQFLHSLKENIWGLKDDSVILLYDDNLGHTQKIPAISFDYVLKLEVIREKPRWRD